MLKSSHWNANLQLSCIKVILEEKNREILGYTTKYSAASSTSCTIFCHISKNLSVFLLQIWQNVRFRLTVFFRLIFGWQKFGGWAGYRLRLGALALCTLSRHKIFLLFFVNMKISRVKGCSKRRPIPRSAVQQCSLRYIPDSWLRRLQIKCHCHIATMDRLTNFTDYCK